MKTSGLAITPVTDVVSKCACACLSTAMAWLAKPASVETTSIGVSMFMKVLLNSSFLSKEVESVTLSV